jgi:hypothetical protein
VQKERSFNWFMVDKDLCDLLDMGECTLMLDGSSGNRADSAVDRGLVSAATIQSVAGPTTMPVSSNTSCA